MGVEGKNLRQYNREIKNRPHRKARPVWRSGWDSNPRNLAVQLISSPTGYKQMCIICGHSCPPCCTQRKPCLQGFSDYITKIAPCIRTHKIFSKSVFLSMLGRHRADLGQTSSPRNSLTDRSIVEIFHHREVRYEYETRATDQLGRSS